MYFIIIKENWSKGSSKINIANLDTSSRQSCNRELLVGRGRKKSYDSYYVES